MRAIPTGMSAEAVAEIDRRLTDLETTEQCRVLLAIESGSRAWGFPSPDSDYDCRFIYVRHTDRYLSPWPPRDVIETPLAGELDVNGWDLGKALKLLLKGNAVVIEWLTSPIVYRGDADFRDAMLAFAGRSASREMVAQHYLHLGERQRRLHFADASAVPLKRMFYALRPAAALRWLRLHPGHAVAPMHFPTLMTECDPPASVAAIVADLIVRKAVTRELGAAPLPAPIGQFVDSEFEAAKSVFHSPVTDRAAWRTEAEAIFRAWVKAR